MNLDDETRNLATKLFSLGKKGKSDYKQVLEQFQTDCKKNKALIRRFLILQIRLSLTDKILDSNEKSFLKSLYVFFGFSKEDFRQIFNHVKEGTY